MCIMFPRSSKFVRCACLAASVNGSTWLTIRISSVLAVLGMLQLRAVRILNHVDPLVSSSNYHAGSPIILQLLTRTQYMHNNKN